MGVNRFNRELDNLWYSAFFTTLERTQAERALGVRWEQIEAPSHKIAFLYAAAEALSKGYQEQREDMMERERREAMEGLALRVTGLHLEQRERMFNSWLEVEKERQAKLLGVARELVEQQGVVDTYASLGSSQKLLEDMARQDSGSTRYLAISNCVLGAIGPPSVVESKVENGGEYRRCVLAEEAHRRSFLGWHFINEDLLKQAGCPLYTSRDIANRLPPFKWFLMNRTCRLADGYWHPASEVVRSS